MPHRVLVLLIALGSALPALAQEITVKNDSTVAGIPSFPGASAGSFIPNETYAAWLTSPCSGEIRAAQFYWASQIGAAPASTELAITFFAPGTFPAAGAPLPNLGGGGNAVIATPTLQDGVMNEFRFLDPPADTVPLRVAVAAGQTFVLGLTFLNVLGPGPFAAGPTWDMDGCQPLRNAYDAIPGGWLDACTLGVTGDFVIRAKIQCDTPVPTLGNAGRSALALLVMGLAGGAILLPRLRVRAAVAGR